MVYKLFTLGLKYVLHSLDFRIEQQQEISNNVVCTASKGSDQPGHMHSLIIAFASHLNNL